MRDKVLVTVGAAVRREREKANLSQEELADKAGLHRTYIGGVERGERNLGIKNLIAIAHALSLAPRDLLRDLDVSTDKKRRNA